LEFDIGFLLDVSFWFVGSPRGLAEDGLSMAFGMPETPLSRGRLRMEVPKNSGNLTFWHLVCQK
jgi:hypothetical protein